MALSYRAGLSTATAFSGSSFSVPKPAGVVAGDTVVIVISSHAGYAASATGFTAKPVAGNTADCYVQLLERYCDGSEGASFTVTTTASTSGYYTSFAVAGATSSFTGGNWSYGGGSLAAMPASGITVPSSGDWCLWLGFLNASSPTISPPSGYATQSQTTVAGRAFLLADNETVAAGPTGTITGTAGTSGSTVNWCATLIAFAPSTASLTLTVPTAGIAVQSPPLVVGGGSVGTGAEAWAVTANAALTIDPAVGFAGPGFTGTRGALKINCLATGLVTVTRNAPVLFSPPSGLSWGLQMTGSVAGITVTGNMDSYDASSTHTNTQSTTQTTLASWRPLSGLLGGDSPLGGGVTTKGVFTLTLSMTAGQSVWIDAYDARAEQANVLIDWLNPAFGPYATAGTDFSNMSPYVRYDQTIQLDRGRQDALSDVQPGGASLQLQNDNGWFTPQCSQSPWGAGITLGRRIQVNVTDESGVWNTRFDGSLSNLDYTVDATGNTNICHVTANDVLSYLARQNTLSCWTKEIVLQHEPQLHWSLNDDASIGQFYDSSGNNGPSLSPINYGYSSAFGTLNYQGASGGVETEADSRTGTTGLYSSPLTGAGWTPAFITQTTYNNFSGTNGFGLLANLPTPVAPNVAGASWTVELWFTMDPAIHATYKNSKVGPFCVLGLGESRTGYNISAGMYTQASGDALFKLCAQTQPPSFPGTSWGQGAPAVTATIASTLGTDTQSQPHHMVITFTGAASGGKVNLWLDGLNVGNYNLARSRFFDRITIGSAYQGFGSWFGGISLVSVYTHALNTQQINDHYHSGLWGMWASQSDQIIYRLAELAGMPNHWNAITSGGSSLSLADYFDLTGNNALQAMQTVESLEGGLLFVDAKGRLNFHTRQYRMGALAPSVTLPEATFAPELGITLDDQYLITEATTASYLTSKISAGQSSADTSAAATFGDYPKGTPDSPLQVSLYAYSLGYGLAGLQGLNNWVDPEVTDYGSWQVFSNSTPLPRYATLTVDLLSPDAAQPAKSALLGVEIDSVVKMGTLPKSLPDAVGMNEMFVEGMSETLSQTEHTVQYYVTNANPQRAWKPGDATYGLLGATARIGRSGVDTHTVDSGGKNRAKDAGPPFWPPTFATSMNSSGDVVIWDDANATYTGPNWSMKSSKLYWNDSAHFNTGANATDLASFTFTGTRVRMLCAQGPDSGIVNVQIDSGTTVPVDNFRHKTKYRQYVFDSGTLVPGLHTIKVTTTNTHNDASTGTKLYLDAFAVENAATAAYGFVGGRDMRGIAYNLNQLLNPPMFCVGQFNNTQSMATASTARVNWDYVWIDNQNGMGMIANWPNWYVVTQTGYYDLDLCIVWSRGTQGNAKAGRARIIIASQAAAAILNGTGDPSTVNVVDIVGQTVPFNSVSHNVICTASTRVYLQLGDMLGADLWQDTGAAYTTGTDYSGSMFSGRWTGLSTANDRFSVGSR